MYKKAAIIALLAHHATATISLLTFPASGCSGEFTNNIRSNPADQFEASGCVATNPFTSVRVAVADPGYHCNIYSDNACTSIVDGVSEPELCKNVNGGGVIRFSQNKFDNPFDGATG